MHIHTHTHTYIQAWIRGLDTARELHQQVYSHHAVLCSAWTMHTCMW